MLDSGFLLSQYVDVCNQALSLNGERFPYKQILGAARDKSKSRVVEVHVEGDRDTSYVLKFDGGKIVSGLHDDCADCRCDAQWHVSPNYLEDVISHPAAYLKNPARINWEWLGDF